MKVFRTFSYSLVTTTILALLPSGARAQKVFFACTSFDSSSSLMSYTRPVHALTDMTGDRLADPVFFHSNPAEIRVAPSGPRPPVASLWSNSTSGLVGDVDGDGKSDVVVADTGNMLHVLRSTGTSLLPPVSWSPPPGFAFAQSLLADVTGDGKADLVGPGGTQVRRSTGTSFGPLEDWGQFALSAVKFVGAGDVNGDGSADYVVVLDTIVVVRRSDGTRFLTAETWLSGVASGPEGTHLADVNGDGLVDVIAVHPTHVTVRRSTRTSFGPEERWGSEGLQQGTRENPEMRTSYAMFGDVTGDRCADMVVSTVLLSGTRPVGVGISVRRGRSRFAMMRTQPVRAPRSP